MLDFYLFIFFLRSLHAHCGTWTHNPKTKTQAEIKSGTFNSLSHPGAPNMLDF